MEKTNLIDNEWQKEELEQPNLPVLAFRKSSNGNMCDICYEAYHIAYKWPMKACSNGHEFCDICLQGMFTISEDEPVPCPLCRNLIYQRDIKVHETYYDRIHNKNDVKQFLKDEPLKVFEFAFQNKIHSITKQYKNSRTQKILNSSHLNCSFRKLESIKYFSTFKNLKYLELHHNYICDLQGLKQLQNLRIVNLNNNFLTSLNGVQYLKHLEILAIQSNSIQKITFNPVVVGLKSFFTFGNRFTDSIVKDLFHSKFISLQIFSISFCQNKEKSQKLFLNSLKKDYEINSKSKNLVFPELKILFSEYLETSNIPEQQYVEIISNLSFIDIRWRNISDSERYQNDIAKYMGVQQTFGENFQFIVDCKNPHAKDYKIDNNSKTIMKGNCNFTLLNSKDPLPLNSQICFKFMTLTKGINILVGICDQSLKHSANLYSESFIGLALWGSVYDRGNSRPVQYTKMKLQTNSVISMIVDRQKQQITWYLEDKELAKAKFPEFFSKNVLYFVIGMRDKDEKIKLISII